MNYRLIVLFATLLLFISCAKDSENEANIVVGNKQLSSINHVFYNYNYIDQPPTRTYTTNYTLNAGKINFINSSVFHYWHDDPGRNYTAYWDSNFSYDSNNRLIRVEEDGYSEYDLSEAYTRIYEFDYYEDDKIRRMLTKDGNGTLYSKYTFVHQNNTIEQTYEYYENEEMIFYHETIYELDANQRIYRQTSKGPIFESTDEDTISETTQKAIFDVEGNVDHTFFNGSPSTEFEYSDIKIPSDLPKINMPFHGYIPYILMLAQFDEIIQLYSTNYLKTMVPLDATNNYTISYKNILSKDNYPLSIEVFYNDKIRSETTYSYE